MTILETSLLFITSFISASWYLSYKSSDNLQKRLITEIERMQKASQDILDLNEEMLSNLREKDAAYKELHTHYQSLFNAHFELQQNYARLQSAQPN